MSTFRALIAWPTQAHTRWHDTDPNQRVTAPGYWLADDCTPEAAEYILDWILEDPIAQMAKQTTGIRPQVKVAQNGPNWTAKKHTRATYAASLRMRRFMLQPQAYDVAAALVSMPCDGSGDCAASTP
jgi:hypothetical protein